MQELAQLGGTGNKIMAYAVPSDVDLANVLCQGNVAPSDDIQWPFLRDEEMNQNERSNTLAQLSGDPLAAKANSIEVLRAASRPPDEWPRGDAAARPWLDAIAQENEHGSGKRLFAS
jgi:hypothetical protein